MSKAKQPDYVCFRCGEQENAYAEDCGGVVCGNCGEFDTCVTFTTACDLLNNLWLSGVDIYTNEEKEELQEVLGELLEETTT